MYFFGRDTFASLEEIERFVAVHSCYRYVVSETEVRCAQECCTWRRALRRTDEGFVVGVKSGQHACIPVIEEKNRVDCVFDFYKNLQFVCHVMGYKKLVLGSAAQYPLHHHIRCPQCEWGVSLHQVVNRRDFGDYFVVTHVQLRHSCSPVTGSFRFEEEYRTEAEVKAAILEQRKSSAETMYVMFSRNTNAMNGNRVVYRCKFFNYANVKCAARVKFSHHRGLGKYLTDVQQPHTCTHHPLIVAHRVTQRPLFVAHEDESTLLQKKIIRQLRNSDEMRDEGKSVMCRVMRIDERVYSLRGTVAKFPRMSAAEALARVVRSNVFYDEEVSLENVKKYMRANDAPAVTWISRYTHIFNTFYPLFGAHVETVENEANEPLHVVTLYGIHWVYFPIAFVIVLNDAWEETAKRVWRELKREYCTVVCDHEPLRAALQSLFTTSFFFRTACHHTTTTDVCVECVREERVRCDDRYSATYIELDAITRRRFGCYYRYFVQLPRVVIDVDKLANALRTVTASLPLHLSTPPRTVPRDDDVTRACLWNTSHIHDNQTYALPSLYQILYTRSANSLRSFEYLISNHSPKS